VQTYATAKGNLQPKASALRNCCALAATQQLTKKTIPPANLCGSPQKLHSSMPFSVTLFEKIINYIACNILNSL
jgi:hypothetical protein